MIKLSDLTPHPDNPRKITDAQMDKLKDSIRRDPEYMPPRPLVVNRDNVILAGNQRWKALKALGHDEIPEDWVRFVDWDEEKSRRFVIMDNHQSGEWDEEILLAKWTDLDLDDLGLELDVDFEPEVEGLTDEDDVPDEPAEPVSKVGDVWLLGEHRVMCGDSTSKADVEKLMEGKKADMVFTDPPYGMSYGGGRAAGDSVKFKNRSGGIKAHGRIKGDDLHGGSLVDLIRDSIGLFCANKKEGGASYICFTWRTYREFEEALKQASAEIKACIVWNKKSIGLGYSNYRPQHEFIFYCGGQWYGEKNESDVWEMSRGATGDYVHPTQKPVELIERALKNSSKSGDAISDAFLGSGSTLIACEKTNRTCYGMELDPGYCDVIITRWQNFTGRQAVHAETGKTFGG